ncbi:hypothetical protein DM47_3094 [Burkholderia mallei]|nr:hypothetical protein DM46_2462 [Burkholderia mallei]KOS94889.1 hypothetical protein DM45_3645 [Burkholderia mallei]KOS97454.1 hypothetical protein DM49_3865 [Burkholderia mallei]KOT11049.1 hypothetical protein DM77_3178 [Burkholderia mallei]KOT19848.1 hypothetical protein DM47_3094 [Burkholderia mallei]
MTVSGGARAAPSSAHRACRRKCGAPIGVFLQCGCAGSPTWESPLRGNPQAGGDGHGTRAFASAGAAVPGPCRIAPDCGGLRRIARGSRQAAPGRAGSDGDGPRCSGPLPAASPGGRPIGRAVRR